MNPHFYRVAVSALLLACVVSVQGAAVNGRFSTWGYVRDDSVDHVYVVPQLALNVYQLGHRDLSFQTSLRGFGDLQDGKSGDEQLRLQRAVLIYAPLKSKWEFRGGQQWITEGVGYGHVAGLWVKHSLNTKSAITAYGGTRLASSLDLNQENESEGMSGGLRFMTRLRRTSLGVSYFLVQKDGDVLFHGAGIEGSSDISKDLRIRARLDANLEESSLETGQLYAIWSAHERVQISGEYRHETPRIFEDSYFARFLEEAGADFVRADARWTACRTVYLSGGGLVLPTEEDLLYKVRVAVGIPEIEVGYSHWLSVAEGDMDGFYGQAHYSFHEQLSGFGGVDFSRGSNSITRPNTESRAAYAGFNVEPLADVHLSARVEQVEDNFRKEDWRGLFSLAIHFSTLRN